MEFHGTDNMPPIRIVIADGEDNEDVVIKVSDEGGGIPRSHIMRIWSYLFTTADPAIQQVGYLPRRSPHSPPSFLPLTLPSFLRALNKPRASWT